MSTNTLILSSAGVVSLSAVSLGAVSLGAVSIGAVSIGAASPGVVSPGAVFVGSASARPAESRDTTGLVFFESERPSLATQAAAGFAELQALAERPFEWIVSPENGAVGQLHGGRLALADEPVAAARELVTRFGAVFGLAPDLAPVLELRAGPRPRVHATFRHDGLEVFGVEAHVMFDELGRIVGARVRGGRGATELGEFELDSTTARAAARAAVSEQRLALARPDGDEPPAPNATRIWTAVDGGLVPTWRFVYPTTEGDDGCFEAWTIDVDARLASESRWLRVRDEIERGTGLYPTGVDVVPFKTGAAKASGFKNVAAALVGKAKTQKLKTWAVDGVPLFPARPEGSPVFARADVVGASGTDIVVQSGNFLFPPLGVAADHFDVANTAFQLESFGKHLKQALGVQPGPDFAMPVIVNALAAKPISFFTPTNVVGQTTTAGIVLTELFNGPDDVDMSRDPAIIGHEWMHAVMHFESVSSLETSFHPITAVREGIADFFAAAKQKDTVVGRCVEQAYGVPARDFADGEHLDRAFDEASASSPSDLPDDHRLGEVFAAVLQDVRELEGTKTAERLAFAVLPKLARTTAEASNLSYSVATAEAITRSVAVNFVTGLSFAASDLGKSKAEDQRLRLAVIGAATARGVINAPGKIGIMQNFTTGLKPKLTLRTRIVDPDPALHHRFSLSVDEDDSMRVVVRGREGFRPSVVLTNVILEDLVISADGTKISMLVDPVGPILKIDVSAAEGEPGRYDLTLERLDP
ncbi:MAG: hypothetical protein L6Q99_20045 [Planctomycetes bacterium]|nr:hypothetical protein [Planctomycetota bacterium]